MPTLIETHAKNIRRNVVKSIYAAGSGHYGGSLSCVDILAALHPLSAADKFVLSKGHAAPALYATLAEYGEIPEEELLTLRQIGSRLQGHPDRRCLPCLDAGTGALGQGLSIALGYALAAKMHSDTGISYCLVGDGELQEGQCWEAIMAASALDVRNLVCIVDKNDMQNETLVDNTLPMGDLRSKFDSFGWGVSLVDGHNFDDLSWALERAKTSWVPLAIIASTVKGKGVSFMEHNNYWHSGVMNDEEYIQAMEELA